MSDAHMQLLYNSKFADALNLAKVVQTQQRSKLIGIAGFDTEKLQMDAMLREMGKLQARVRRLGGGGAQARARVRCAGSRRRG